MTSSNYHTLKVLIADDFSNFRNTIQQMLVELGVSNIAMANSAETVIEKCEHERFDIVLCDYNLGSGRNGQHVLEELRHRQLIDSQAVFILVSAEAGRNIVMSAYDSAPDDYLMKPITAQMLQGRLKRLLAARAHFAGVYQALDRGDKELACERLIAMSLEQGRHTCLAQKMLGELFLELGEYRKAEKLYQRVLESRELDWARLGLAKAKQLMGDLEQAEQWLERIIDENYLFLPAYDTLSENYLARGDTVKAQDVVKQSVEVSPMSILRQKNLAGLARDNKARDLAVEAMHKVVRLGRFSCFGRREDKLLLARAVADALEHEVDVSASLFNEACELLSDKQQHAELDTLANVQLLYIQARLFAGKGELDTAKQMVVEAETRLTVEDSDIDVELDHIRALLSLDYEQKCNQLLERLQELYADDQQALEKLDEFLSEPASEASKALVAEVNREGIELYNQERYDEALACFDKALQLFPKHLGLKLNIVQAMLGKMKHCDDDSLLESVGENSRDALENIAAQIDEHHAQFKRFLQLKAMALKLNA
ncbi:tetratricopeptide repeat-containing response regulator [Agaribacterium haliotis]|uniref:tetratricopeptide repeat-containing response regulator n=1 Tax=Agaribacterium haliotis TaxID=2013869 RepID=UPI000BB57661|nr:tetratricopeptide repeat-containing response regulator [Agaribacterium haliotis]